MKFFFALFFVLLTFALTNGYSRRIEKTEISKHHKNKFVILPIAPKRNAKLRPKLPYMRPCGFGQLHDLAGRCVHIWDK